MTWLILGTFLFIVASVVLVLIILAQRPQGGGLASAFGGSGGGSTDTAFGGRTGDVLTYATIGAFIGYVFIAITLNILDNRLMTGDIAEIEAGEAAVGSPLAEDALEFVPNDFVAETTGITPPAESSSSGFGVAPLGSTENDLPGQE
ncbi:MAG TPA: preprotein translocase subunit SecG [Phycisphaerales bacterium]|nr:preprotein translocase subunit SecG [Phycisphaerales bacterium]|tara:strand:- start:81 stop:521 length:441 start_codon:yes stop_codon:yes gene_type:complete